MSEGIHIVCPHCSAINRLPRERLDEGPVCGKCQQALFTGHPLALNEAGFTRHVDKNDLPLVVDFWAPWCGPCLGMAPEFEKAAKLLEPAVRLAKVNTEETQALSQRFNIRSIPTLAVFRGGREVARQSGAMSAQAIAQWVKAQL